jgi:hypothetical protein
MGLVKNWFKSPDRWCQKHAAVDEQGEEIGCNPRNLGQICALCIYGAVVMWYPKYDDQERIFKAIRLETGCESIGKWNDTHTFEEMVALVEKLEI